MSITETRTNVIPLPNVIPLLVRPAIVLPLRKFLGPDAVAILSNEIKRWMQTAMQTTPISMFAALNLLARKAGISHSTVQNIMTRRTREPRLSTIMHLLIALDFALMRLEPGTLGDK